MPTDEERMNAKIKLVLARLIDELTPEYSNDWIECFLLGIVDRASSFWIDAAADDFCVQLSEIGISYSPYIIFGGTNRVKWTSQRGFMCLWESCTPEFRKRFAAVMRTTVPERYREGS